jgi:acyl-CoA thioester hydrolase
MLSEYSFQLALSVRDYECDMQGIVNNSVYMNYLEHARHQFLLESGVDFAKATAEGLFLVMTQAELTYKKPLRSGDHFTVALRFEAESKVRGVFDQAIFNTQAQLMLSARIRVAAMNPAGRPVKAETVFTQLSAKPPSALQN